MLTPTALVVLLSWLTTTSASSTPLTKRAPRAISVKSYTELGAITQNSYVVGRDNGQSVSYNGSSYWFFDDTTMTDGFISNSGAVTTDLDASNGITLTSALWTGPTTSGTPGLLMPLTTDETNFQNAHSTSTGCTGSSDSFCGMSFANWPGAVFVDTSGSRIIVGYGKLCRGSQGSSCSNGSGIGTGLSWGFFAAYPYYGLGTRLTPSSGGLTDATGLHDPNAFGSASSVSFTSGAVVSGSYVYLYGGVSILAGAQVARVPISTFENTTTWAYYDGSSYQSNPSNAKGVMALGAAGNTVFYSSALGGYYNVYSGYGSSAVYMQSASAPEGPWSSSVMLFNSTQVNGGVNYAVFAHPEYASSDGLTQYISYFQTGSGKQMLVKVVLN